MCRRGLPQGAPTSPIIANSILSSFDTSLASLCKAKGYAYTRYADDISISMPNDDAIAIKNVIGYVDFNLEKNGFELNKKHTKLKVLRKHQAQRICGITINSEKPTISRKQRRLIRAAKHNIKNGKKTTLTMNQIDGHEAFHRMIMNPNTSLEKKP